MKPDFDLDAYIHHLTTLVGFRTEVCRNRNEFERTNQWIKDFLDGLPLEFIEFECHGVTSMIIKPIDSERPRMIGDGHAPAVGGHHPPLTPPTPSEDSAPQEGKDADSAAREGDWLLHHGVGEAGRGVGPTTAP